MSKYLSESDEEPQDDPDDILEADLTQALSEEIDSLKQEARQTQLRRRQLIRWRSALLNGHTVRHQQPARRSPQ